MSEWQTAPVYVNVTMPDGTVLRYVCEAHVPDVDQVCEGALAWEVMPAVPSEAVRAMRLWPLLERLHQGVLPDDACCEAEFGDVLALADWGLVAVKGLGHDAPWCEGQYGAVLYAVLAQAADPGAWVPRAALQFLADELAQSTRERCMETFGTIGNPDTGAVTSEYWMDHALAAGHPAAPEPGHEEVPHGHDAEAE